MIDFFVFIFPIFIENVLSFNAKNIDIPGEIIENIRLLDIKLVVDFEKKRRLGIVFDWGGGRFEREDHNYHYEEDL